MVALLFPLAIAEGTFLHGFALRGVVASPVFVFVVWYALRADLERTLLFALFAGVLTDGLSAGTGGAWTIATLISTVVIAIVRRIASTEELWFVLALTAVSTLLRNAMFWLAMYFAGFPVGLATVHFHTAVWQAFLNACIMLAPAAWFGTSQEGTRW
jgi:rod shape-determining protein MreD